MIISLLCLVTFINKNLVSSFKKRNVPKKEEEKERFLQDNHKPLAVGGFEILEVGGGVFRVIKEIIFFSFKTQKVHKKVEVMGGGVL